ncbi:hypothetical protein CSKR_110892 [Clonorchis sinensis]|uniref:Uncharacterized protein n=1 Tax=Clonorchis sinensis TaxID=79923 RepID=A0A419PH22_CLOSI|nr:hypothetical protein CSKR_110892 [Clonorchis sinensis]
MALGTDRVQQLNVPIKNNFSLSSNPTHLRVHATSGNSERTEVSQKQSSIIINSFQWKLMRWLWLEREFTNGKVRGSNPTSAYRLPLSWLGQLGSIRALVLPSGGMAVRHRKGATAEPFLYFLEIKTVQGFQRRNGI